MIDAFSKATCIFSERGMHLQSKEHLPMWFNIIYYIFHVLITEGKLS